MTAVLEPGRAPTSDVGKVLLRADNVSKGFQVRARSSGRRSVIHAVDDVSLDVRVGETLGLVGPTGCGKSTLARCLARLCPVTSGRVTLDGLDVTRLSGRELRPVRRQLQVVFQDPAGALNPRRRVGSIIGEPLAVHRLVPSTVRKQRVQELMDLVGLNPEHYNRFPAEFSGGQRQRIGIARALASEPRLIVCDEPVSALDVSIQAQILNLLADLQRDLGLSYLFIAHDLSVVRYLSHRVAVMHLGRIVEIGDADGMYTHPQHPYTEVLVSSLPAAEPDRACRRTRSNPEGEPPSPANPPSGCTFQSQCPDVRPVCRDQRPKLEGIDGFADHATACFFPLGAREIVLTRVSAAPVVARPDTQSRPAPVTEDARSAGPSVATARSPTVASRGPWRLAWDRLRRDRLAIASLVVITLVVVWALAAPLMAALLHHPANEQYHETGQTPGGLPVGPRSEFWFGTDDLGRDLLVRVGYGLRLSLVVGLVATLVTVVIGVGIGLLAGYFGGVLDTLLARLMDVVLAFPFLLLAISMVSVVGPSVRTVIAVIALFSWASVARIVRGQVLTIKQKEFVEAARAVGASDTRILVLDVLPNALAPIIVYTTLLIPAVIVLEASLSFLGVGAPPPTADLGAMLSSSLAYYRQAWWFVAFPGAALLGLTLAFNLLGDAVRDALDPHTASMRPGKRRTA